MNEAVMDPSNLLCHLEDILDSDPHIDEVGFIHPMQFAAFNEEDHSGSGTQLTDEITRKPVRDGSSHTFFWHSKHKLGISTIVLVPLYRAAKDAFLDAYKRYRMLRDSQLKKDETLENSALTCLPSSLDTMENEVMRHSKALVLLSCDFGTAWNARKLIVSRKLLSPMFTDELLLSALVLCYSPKSERAWSHRRWVIKMIAGNSANMQEIVERESELVKTLAEVRNDVKMFNVFGIITWIEILNSKMNYRAWSHRCWLVSYMSDSQVLLELQSSRDWAGLHVADNSCFHYRSRLLLRMIENLRQNNDSDGFSGAEFHLKWKDELDWVGMLIKRYVGREALWLHRRFLSLVWMKHLAIDDQCGFIKDEITLSQSSTIIPDNDYEDYQAQATYSATYILWLAKQMPMSFGVELRKSSHYEALNLLVGNVGKSCLWDSTTSIFELCDDR